MATIITARGIVDGKAGGPALVSHEAISFLGDVDIRSGTIVGDLPSVHGACVRGTVLLMPYTRGSAGAWRFLFQLFKHNSHPVAIITGTVPDPSVVQGAILAGIPVACEPARPLETLLCTGQRIEVEVEDGKARITLASAEG